jgi:hypothetical protein
MAQDLSKSKKLTGSVYPEGAYDAVGGIDRIEPLLTAKLLKTRFLGGIPLEYPITKEKIAVSEIKDYIKRAVNLVELESKVLIQPTIRRIKLPFDPNLYLKYIYCEVPHKPIQKVIKMAITSASYKDTAEADKQYPSGAELYVIPNEWVDTSYALHGRLTVNPINPAFSAVNSTDAMAASGASVLMLIGQQGWVPAYWSIEAVFGFCTEDGNVPVFINEIVGTKAAMLILDNLIPAYRTASQSLSMDGMGQSVNDLGYQLLTQKRQTLEATYKGLINQLKGMTGSKFFSSNV